MKGETVRANGEGCCGVKVIVVDMLPRLASSYVNSDDPKVSDRERPRMISSITR